MVNLLSSKQKAICEVCGREITKEDYSNYEGMCWECWDDQLAKESDSAFDYPI